MAPNDLLQKRLGTPSKAKAPKELTMPLVDDRWMENSLARRLMPGTVESILRNGLSGDLTDQLALFNVMLDTWPRLQHNVRTLCEAVEAAPFEVHPWSDDDGTEITDTAQEKASLVTRALWGMKPDLKRMEFSLEDAVKGMARGTVQGHCVQEILWEVREDVLGQAMMPRAMRRVGTQHYGYPGWSTGQADALMFRPDKNRTGRFTEFPDYQFLTGIFPGHDGHPSIAAPLRSLAKYWVAATFGVEWLISYAQLFGQPFRWATYKNETAKAAVCGMLANIGAAAWGAFPEGTVVNLEEARASAGELPQTLLIKLAEEACDILILGQTLSSDTGDKGGGSYALGKVHATVRRERLSACAGQVAKVLTHQLAHAVIHLNYGECTECPEIRADLPEPEDQKANAERDDILHKMGLPMAKEFLYERHGIPIPDDDDDLLEAPAPPVAPGLPGQPVDPDAKAKPSVPGKAKAKGKDKDKDKPEPKTDEEKAAAVKAAQATARTELPDSFLSLLTETNVVILEHAAARGWAAAQVELSPEEEEPGDDATTNPDNTKGPANA